MNFHLLVIILNMEIKVFGFAATYQFGSLLWKTFFAFMFDECMMNYITYTFICFTDQKSHDFLLAVRHESMNLRYKVSQISHEVILPTWNATLNPDSNELHSQIFLGEKDSAGLFSCGKCLSARRGQRRSITSKNGGRLSVDLHPGRRCSRRQYEDKITAFTV